MNQMTEPQLRTHIPIVGWLFVAYSVLNMIAGLVAFLLIMSGSLFWSGMGTVAVDPESTRVFAVFNTITVLTAVVIGILMIGLALPSLIAGIGLLARKAWARTLCLVLSALMLLAFPLGTLVGAYAIYVLTQHAAENCSAIPPAGARTISCTV